VLLLLPDCRGAVAAVLVRQSALLTPLSLDVELGIFVANRSEAICALPCFLGSICALKKHGVFGHFVGLFRCAYGQRRQSLLPSD
jgi:hypothetical protein